MLSDTKEFFTVHSFGKFAWKTIALLLLPFMWLNVLAVVVGVCAAIFICWLIAIPKSVIEVIRGKKRSDEYKKLTAETEDPWFVNCKSPTLP